MYFEYWKFEKNKEDIPICPVDFKPINVMPTTKCPTCSVKFEGYVVNYVCPRNNCPLFMKVIT